MTTTKGTPTMTTVLPKKIEDLLELGRAHGWTATTEPYDEPIEGLSEAVGVALGRELDDGRLLVFLVAYGRRLGARPSWLLLHDDKGFVAFAEVRDDDVPDFLGPDLARRWKAASDLRYWIEHPDDLVALWQESKALRPRGSLRDRIIPGGDR